jgi:hypothetical protein
VQTGQNRFVGADQHLEILTIRPTDAASASRTHTGHIRSGFISRSNAAEPMPERKRKTASQTSLMIHFPMPGWTRDADWSSRRLHP